MTFESLLAIFIWFIIIVKIIFISSSLIGRAKHHGKKDDTDDIWAQIREKTELIFIVSMAILLIIIFSPRQQDVSILTPETRILFFLFGWVLLITADWSAIITPAPWFKEVQGILKGFA